MSARRLSISALIQLLALAPLSAQSGSWQLESVTNTSILSGGSYRMPVLRVDAAGTAHAVFYMNDSGVCGGYVNRGDMYSTSRLAPGSWSAPQFIACNAAHRTSLQIDALGGMYVSRADPVEEREQVWWRGSSSSSWVQYPGADYLAGSFWRGGMGGAVVLETTGQPGLGYFCGGCGEDANYGLGGVGTPVQTSNRVGKGMQAAMSSSGEPLLAYFDQDQSLVVFAERNIGGWATTSNIPSLTGHDPIDIDSGPNGDVALLSRQSDAGPVNLHRRRASTWTVENLGGSSTAYQFARADVDASGALHIAAVTEGGRIHYLTDRSGSWMTEEVVQGEQGWTQAEIAVTPGGQPRIMFVRSDGHLIMAVPGWFTPYCYGDGSGMTCPCNNPGRAGRGCDNRSLSGGGLLSGTGVASVSQDTVCLTATGLNATTAAMLIQGASALNGGDGLVFGNGLRCVQSVIRLKTRTSTAGAVLYGPCAGDLQLSILGAIPPTGGTCKYQVWYRDSWPATCVAPFNLTNGLSVTWVP